jgi:UrcA family protein
MNSRKLACLVAAGFLGAGLVSAATQSHAAPRPDATIEGKSIDPALQRTVSYKDLNLAFQPDQRRLDRRIWRTASTLCVEINGFFDNGCTTYAVHSTDDQVAAAIQRAKLRMAGLPAGPAVAISMVIGAQ